MPQIWKLPRRVWAFCSFVPKTVDRRYRVWVVRYLLALVVLRGRKNGARIAALYPPAHRSSVSRFQAQRRPLGQWLEEAAWQTLVALGWRPGETVYLIIDSTHQARRGKKLHNIQKFKVEGARQYIIGHAVVAVILVYRGQRIPLVVEPYRTRRWCEAQGVTFRSQPEIAARALRRLTLPQGLSPIVLFDSGFFGKPLLKALPRTWQYVSVAKRQRVMTCDKGVRTSIKEHLLKLVSTPRSFRRTDCANAVGKKRRYWMRREVCHLNKVGRVTLVFSGRRTDQQRWIKPLVTNHLEWTATEVSNHYAQRWHIEVWFKEVKQQLGFGDCSGRKLTQQKTHLQLCALAYLLAIRMTQDQPTASLGKRLARVRGETTRIQWEWLLARAKTAHGLRTAKQCLQAVAVST